MLYINNIEIFNVLLSYKIRPRGASVRMEKEIFMQRLAARLTAPKTIQVFSEPVPEPGPHEMVVRMAAAGICRSELPTYLGEASMVQKGPLGFPCIIDSVPYPAVFGHEPAGIVERTGSEVTRFAPGDRVSGACGGAFASHVVVSEFAPFVKVPDSVSLQSCLAEPVMCCCNIVHAAAMPEGGFAAVVGCGYMGLVTISLLAAHGISNIAAFDIREDRLAKAAECGAAHTFNAADPDTVLEAFALTGGKGFDRVVELSAGLKGLKTAVSLIRRPDATGRGVIIASSVYDKHEMWPAALGF